MRVSPIHRLKSDFLQQLLKTLWTFFQKIFKLVLKSYIVSSAGQWIAELVAQKKAEKSYDLVSERFIKMVNSCTPALLNICKEKNETVVEVSGTCEFVGGFKGAENYFLSKTKLLFKSTAENWSDSVCGWAKVKLFQNKSHNCLVVKVIN